MRGWVERVGGSYGRDRGRGIEGKREREKGRKAKSKVRMFSIHIRKLLND